MDPLPPPHAQPRKSGRPDRPLGPGRAHRPVDRRGLRMNEAELVEVDGLRVAFESDRGRVTEAVSGISFTIARGKTLGLVGESGCGKTVTALALLRLLPKDTARVSGSVRFEGRELLNLPEREVQNLRGNRLAMIFQEPMTSLNPSYTVGDQVGEALIRHRGLSRKDARAKAIEMLRRARGRSPCAG